MKALLVFACALTSLAQQQRDPLLAWMDGINQRQLQAREDAVALVKTRAAAEARKKQVRQRILDAIGGMPTYDGPLNARIKGQIEAEGFVVEKVIYESLPGFYVTANVYRPKQPGRYPAVLLQSGHTQQGKAEPQLLAANLALKGFVALAFDPIGQGEREQSWLRELQAPAAGWSVNEHIHAGAQALLIGEGLARYFLFDAKRSVDYLVSRADVDPDRIGAAGCSGGGALTVFAGGLDPRIKAVAAACYPTSLRVQFAGDLPHTEMLIPGEPSIGIDTADFVELSAPAPWLLMATEKDYFPPAGVKMTYDEVKRWYRLYDAEDRVGMHVGSGPHGTPPESREAIYAWFIRWLRDGVGDAREQPVKMLNNFELLVTPNGRVDDLAGSRKINQLLEESWRAKKRPGTLADLRAELARLKIGGSLAAPAYKVVTSSTRDGVRVEDLRIETEPGVECNATLLTPPDGKRGGALLMVGATHLDPLVQRTAAAGTTVLVFSPRSPVKPDNSRVYIGDWLTATRAELTGTAIATYRARDIGRAVDLLTSKTGEPKIKAAARGVPGIWLLMAAAADGRIDGLWLDRTPYSFAQALDNVVATRLFDAVIPGFLLRWEIADLRAMLGSRRLIWTDPANWMQALVQPGEGYRYRWNLGDLTDMADAQDLSYLRELLQ